MSLVETINESFDSEKAMVQVATAIDHRGLHIPFDRVRDIVSSLADRARITNFILPLAEKQLCEIAVPKDSIPPQLPPETTSDQSG